MQDFGPRAGGCSCSVPPGASARGDAPPSPAEKAQSDFDDHGIQSIVSNQGAGVVVTLGAHAAIARTVVRDSGWGKDGDFGEGIYASAGGVVDLSESAVVNNARAGIDAFQTGTVVNVTASLVRDTHGMINDAMGVGIEAAMGAVATIDQSTVATNRHTGCAAWQHGKMSITGTLIRDTQVEVSSQLMGHGIVVMEASHVDIAASQIQRNAAIGIVVSGSPVTVDDSFIADNVIGIHVQDGSVLPLSTCCPRSAIRSAYSLPAIRASSATTFASAAMRCRFRSRRRHRASERSGALYPSCRGRGMAQPSSDSD